MDEMSREQIKAQAIVATGQMPTELVITNQTTIDGLLEAFKTLAMLLEVRRANGYRLFTHTQFKVYLVKDRDD